MKNYLVFWADQEKPSGGWADFKGDFDSIKDAKKLLKQLVEKKALYCGWFEIIDLNKGKSVYLAETDDYEIITEGVE